MKWLSSIAVKYNFIDNIKSIVKSFIFCRESSSIKIIIICWCLFRSFFTFFRKCCHVRIFTTVKALEVWSKHKVTTKNNNIIRQEKKTEHKQRNIKWRIKRMKEKRCEKNNCCQSYSFCCWSNNCYLSEMKCNLIHCSTFTKSMCSSIFFLWFLDDTINNMLLHFLYLF